MFARLTHALTYRFIEDLRRFWSFHPKYRDRLVGNIQGRHAFRERPQVGMVVKTSGSSRNALSPDNYVGIEHSYVYQTKVQHYAGLSVEWVREDSIAIQNNGGVFPSPPGVYYIEVVENPEDQSLQFYVDPLLDTRGEILTPVDSVTFQTVKPFLLRSLRVYEMPSMFPLQEGLNFTVDSPDTGRITLNQPLNPGTWLVGDYRTPGVTTGPHDLLEMRANHQAIPGVVLAFGRRAEKGDRLAVVVQPIRYPASMVYGGLWQTNVDIDIFARDVFEQREIFDMSLVYLDGILRSYLHDEGIHIEDISGGGEAEDIYDDNADDYYYTSTISLTVLTDWFLHVPLQLSVRSVFPESSTDLARIAGLPSDQLSGETGDIRVLTELGLQQLEDPFFRGRNATFEMIG